MDIIYSNNFLGHATGSHPENPNRLKYFEKLPETDIKSGSEFVSLVHTPQYIQQVHDLGKESGLIDTDTIVLTDTYDVATQAVGAAILASQTDGFALVRPPGHHAFSDHGAGFCIFNNIAIAVQKLVTDGKRVLILDIDGHFGDGTANFYYESNQVFYWSLHQEDAYPHAGRAIEIGSGAGTGYTMNMPLPKDTGDDVYQRALHDLLPIALQFKPNVVAVSAGFDGHYLDPLLELHLTTNTYYAAGALLKVNFPHVFAVLEGGYHNKVLPRCVYSFLDGMNGQALRFTEDASESRIPLIENYEATLDVIKHAMAPHWNIS